LNETNATVIPPPSEEKKKGDKGDKGKDGDKGGPSTSPPPPAPGPPPNIKPPSTPPSSPPPPPPAQQPSPPSSEANGTAAAGYSSIATDPDAEYAKMRTQREADIVRVKAENARKQKEYTDKVTKARARVKELNEKLAGWYYVISNDVYEKIRLERTDFVKAKKKEEGEEGETATPKEVAASHVLVAYKEGSRADPSITRSKEEAKARADSLRKQIVDEAKDFATVARENSDGPSKTKGGDLGKFTFETMAKAFSEAAFALDVGGVSEVVETPFGFHIIKRTE
jgi:parvulin-like peptidyl-prolyl isomerase